MTRRLRLSSSLTGTTAMELSKRLSVALAAVAAGLSPSPLRAQASASDFTSAQRYDLMRRVVGTIAPDPDGSGPLHYAATRNTYDAAGRLVRVEKGELSSWQSETVSPSSWSGFTIFSQVDTGYDAMGHKLREQVSGGGTVSGVTEYSYDLLGHLKCTAVRMNPAAWGAALSDPCVPGPQGSYGPDRVTRNMWDASGQLLKVEKAYGTPLRQDYATYEYSPNGKQTSVTDANGNRAELAYDGFDRQVRWTFPSKTVPGQVNAADYEAYGYDANANRASLRKRDGTTIAYAYDALNRLSVKTVPASASGAPGYSVYTGYDNRGLQTYARFGSAAGVGVTNAYDGYGGLVSSTTTMDGSSRTLSYQYDGDGNKTAVNSNFGYYTGWSWDGAGRAKAVLDGEGSEVRIAYDAAGRRQLMDEGINAATSWTTYGYDPVGRLTSLGHDLAGTGADQGLTFAYNPASQIAARTASNDAYASNTASNVSRAYSVNGLNQYITAGSASLAYDANGNLTSDGASNYVYDAENRLVSRSGGVALSYDPMGRLWQVSAPSGTTRFLYDGDDLVWEHDGAGNNLRAYAHGPGEDEPLLWYEASEGFRRHFLHADHQGSIVAIADPGGNPIAINAYDAWGIPNAANQGRFGYTGQAWLPELGMWYYKARIYSPALGRFLQTDPIGYADQVNLYTYVGNDPVDGRDPSGLARLPGCGSNTPYNTSAPCSTESPNGTPQERAATAKTNKNDLPNQPTSHIGMNGLLQDGPPPTDLAVAGDTMVQMQDDMDQRAVMAQTMSQTDLNERREARFNGAMTGLAAIDGAITARTLARAVPGAARSFVRIEGAGKAAQYGTGRIGQIRLGRGMLILRLDRPPRTGGFYHVNIESHTLDFNWHIPINPIHWFGF